MQIESLEIKNYRLFRDAKLVNMPRLTIVVGENGSGKSTLFDICYRRGGHGRPRHFVDFSRGQGTAITNESVYGQKGAREEREAFQLEDPSVPAIKELGQFCEFRILSEFRSLLENWHISDFHIGDPRPHPLPAVEEPEN